MRRSIFEYSLAVIVAMLVATFATAQETNNDDVINVETRTVQTTLRVSQNGKAKLIERADLRLLIDGKPQDIAYFSANQLKKFTVLLDASSSMRGNRFKRSVWFLNEMVENSLPGQSFDINIFSEQTQFVGTVTKTDNRKVFEKLRKFNPEGETALYVSVVKTLRAFNRDTNTALIVITDGGDNMSTDDTKSSANKLLAQFGTLTYLIVLDTKLAYRTPETAPGDELAKNAVRDFQKILQPVAFIPKNEIELNVLANRLPREAGFLVKIGFDPDELLLGQEIHKLEIVHSNARLQLDYRQQFLISIRRITMKNFKLLFLTMFLAMAFFTVSSQGQTVINFQSSPDLPEGEVLKLVNKYDQMSLSDLKSQFARVKADMPIKEAVAGLPAQWLAITRTLAEIGDTRLWRVGSKALKLTGSPQYEFIYLANDAPIAVSDSNCILAITSEMMALTDGNDDALLGVMIHELAHGIFAERSVELKKQFNATIKVKDWHRAEAIRQQLALTEIECDLIAGKILRAADLKLSRFGDLQIKLEEAEIKLNNRGAIQWNPQAIVRKQALLDFAAGSSKLARN